MRCVNGDIKMMGMRFRGEEFAHVEATLVERLGADLWRATLRPCAHIGAGDRLRFGESTESMACMLAFLDAEVRAIDGEQAVLAFAFSGPALDEALQRLGRTT